MHANNELGTVNDLAALAAATHEVGAYFHTDAIQSLGKVDFNVAELGVDAASFSAHKIYGPKGVGALYLKRGTPFEALLVGGGQESKKRSGTQNVAGATAFATALDIMLEERETEGPRLVALRDRVIQGVLKMDNTELNGAHDAPRLPGTANLVIKGVDAAGCVEAEYLNPKPIPVFRADATQAGGTISALRKTKSRFGLEGNCVAGETAASKVDLILRNAIDCLLNFAG